MNEREQYPNLPADVTIHHCTASAPYVDAGQDVVALKQLWIHDDAIETEESMEMDGSTMFLVCPNCKLGYTVFLGD